MENQKIYGGFLKILIVWVKPEISAFEENLHFWFSNMLISFWLCVFLIKLHSRNDIFKYWNVQNRELSQTFKMKLFVNIVINWKPLIISAKIFVLDLRQGSEYASGMSKIICNNNSKLFIDELKVFVGLCIIGGVIKGQG